MLVFEAGAPTASARRPIGNKGSLSASSNV
jgi:hypothetical protein